MKTVRKITWLKISIPVPTFICRIAAWPVLFCRWLRYGHAFRVIKLTQGFYAKVDQIDYEYLYRYKWRVSSVRRLKYARSTLVCKGSRNMTIMMHRLIMEPPLGYVVDHINGEGLDNRRVNLRLATTAQNNCNRKKIKKGTSMHKGVCFEKRTGRWRAQIIVDGKKMSLGYYENEKTAADVYDTAALKYHKEYAKLNFAQKRNRWDEFTKYLRKLPLLRGLYDKSILKKSSVF